MASAFVRPVSVEDYSSLSRYAPSGEHRLAPFSNTLGRIEVERVQQMLLLQGCHGLPLGVVSLLLESKFLRGGVLLGHIECLVPEDELQPQVSSLAPLLEECIARARSAGCYKVVSDVETDSMRTTLFACGMTSYQLTMSIQLSGSVTGSLRSAASGMYIVSDALACTDVAPCLTSHCTYWQNVS